MSKIRLCLRLSLAIFLATATFAVAEEIDFESELTGQILSTVDAASGLGPIGVFGFRPTAPPGVNTAVIFDSTAPPGLDFDLGTPNETCPIPGPGQGLGGIVGAPNENCVDLGKVLIIAANLGDGNGDGLVDVPNDADEEDAAFTFDFSAIGPVTMDQITLLDVEAEEPFAQVDLYAPGGALLATFILEQTGDNGKTIKGLGPTENVETMVFTINGSGAIDSIIFNVEEPECGDGEVNQPGETCDPPGSTPDVTYPDNLCREDCTYCGDGILDEGEECDPEAPGAPANCTETCELEPFCGDDILQSELGETCEPPGSNAGLPNECRDDCTYCGDGELDDGEECDDGNNTDGDGCSAYCEIEPFCGDGILNLPGETCDPPGSNLGEPDECREDCTYCGDGVLDDGEECDDGNNDDGDGCDAYCIVEEEDYEACTPGYWKVPQHHDSWIPTGYVTGQRVDSVFAQASGFPNLADDSLVEALGYGGGPGATGGAKILLRAATAGVLNASHPDLNYTYDEAGLIAAVNAALASGDRTTMINLAGDIDDDNNEFPCTLD